MTIPARDGWNDRVDDEMGNFDYHWGKYHFRNHAVTEEIKY